MIYKIKKSAVYLLLAIIMTIALSITISAYNGYYYDYDPGWFGILGVACFAWILIWFIIFIAIGIWVYKDAEKRGKSGALWLIIVILLGIIGIIIWLLVRPPIGGYQQQPAPSTGRMCPSCGRPIPMDARICPYCGKRFEL